MPSLRQTLLKFPFAFLIVLSGVLGVSYLQNRFDEADMRKAVGAIRQKFPQETRDHECVSTVLSRFRGVIRVECGTQSWDVDVVRGIIEAHSHPSSP